LVFSIENSEERYRSRLRIIRDILSVVRSAGDNRPKKTHIMYGANLSYRLLKKYLEDVLKTGLIKYDGKAYYTITEKGKMFLKLYEVYEENCKEIEKHVTRLKNEEEKLEEMLRP